MISILPAKVVKIERNTKGKLVFLCIFEMQPTFDVVRITKNGEHHCPPIPFFTLPYTMWLQVPLRWLSLSMQ